MMARRRDKHRNWLNQLTDSFISSEILPRISLKDAVRCSILSTKWRILWTKMPRLNFSFHDFQNLQPQKVEEIIDGVLHLLSASTLESFQVEAFSDGYSNAHVCKWIEFAALKGVKSITLRNLVNINTAGRKRRLEIPSSLFACNTLTNLELVDLAFPKIPSTVEGFHYLKKCSLNHILGLNDEALQQLLGLCPLVENLGFEYCGQLRNLIISAPNLRCLSIEYCFKVKSLKTECPQLREIKLAHGIFREDNPWSEFKLLEGFSAVESMKSITLINYGGIDPPPNFSLAVLGRFPHLEELIIHGECFEEKVWFMEEEEEEAKDVSLPNLKKVSVYIYPPVGEGQLTLLKYLLRNSPRLNIMRVSLPLCPLNVHDQEFINELLELERASTEAKIFTTTRKGPNDEPCCENIDHFEGVRFMG